MDELQALVVGFLFPYDRLWRLISSHILKKVVDHLVVVTSEEVGEKSNIILTDFRDLRYALVKMKISVAYIKCNGGGFIHLVCIHHLIPYLRAYSEYPSSYQRGLGIVGRHI